MTRRVLFFMACGSPIGGVETWLDHVCRDLPKYGWSPIVALAWGLKTHDPVKFRQFHPWLETVTVDGRGLPRSSRVQACLRTLRRLKPRAVLPLGLIDSVPACGLAKQSDAKLRVIARTQGLLEPMLADLEDYRDVFDMAVCPGRLNAKYLKEVAGFLPSRVRHVPNAADEPVRSRVPRRVGQPLRLAYVGRLTEKDKRATDLPALYEALLSRGISFELTIVGDGPARGQLEKSLEGRPYVNFLGAVPHAEVYERIYPATDCLLSFSVSESFGISVIEAMMNGVVPVTSRFLGLRSEGAVVENETGLTFSIGDMPAAADAIARIERSEGLLERLSKSATASAQSRYCWESCTTGWVQCLNDVLEMSQNQGANLELLLNTENHGLLDRWHVPTRITDAVRRLRRHLNPTVAAGGEEWPLYRRHHSAARLNQIAQTCERLEGAQTPSVEMAFTT